LRSPTRSTLFPYTTLFRSLIQHRKLSPVELVQAHLDRIARVNPKINAYVHLDAERALTAARNAELAIMRNEAVGPLHGVPISIKDRKSTRLNSSHDQISYA